MGAKVWTMLICMFQQNTDDPRQVVKRMIGAFLACITGIRTID